VARHPGQAPPDGLWKAPDGVELNSSFEYLAATREFGAYWSLPLTGAAPAGSWTFEAQVDGQPAGAHTFEITGASSDGETSRAAGPVPLTRQEMFARALAASVTVEALDAEGKVLARGPGTLLDGGDLVRHHQPGGYPENIRRSRCPVDTDRVVVFDPAFDWVILHVTGLNALPPARAASIAAVGTPKCVTVGVGAGGALAVTAAEVVGVNDVAPLGRRYSISLFNGSATAGAPVLDEFGRLLGTVSGGLSYGSGRNLVPMQDLTAMAQTMVVPIEAVIAAREQAPLLLADLAAKGVFTAAVTLGQHVLSGGFAARVPRDGARTQPIDQKTEFGVHEKGVTTFVTCRREPGRG
jgi:hypothetical protein